MRATLNKFWNFEPKKVSVRVEGNPNQIYAKGIMPHDVYHECAKFLEVHIKKIGRLMTCLKTSIWQT